VDAKTNCSNLDCQQFNERVNALLDRRIPLTDDAAVAKHARKCFLCNDDLERLLLVQDRVESMPTTSEQGASTATGIEKDIDISDSVVAQWAAQLPEPPTGGWRSSRIFGIACLLILLPLILVAISFYPRSEKAPPLSDSNKKPSVNSPEEPDSNSSVTPNTESPNQITQGLTAMLGNADQGMDALDTYRPTLHLLGFSKVFDSIDLTLDLVLQNLNVKDTPTDSDGSDEKQSAQGDND